MFRLHTFGGLSIEIDGLQLDDLSAQRKSLALLAVIAASDPGGVSRETLMALLWSDSDAERARGALNQSLHVLRRRLGPNALLGSAELRVNPECIDSDVARFRRAHSDAEFEAAANACTGDFLAGVHLDNALEFEHWLDQRRHEFGVMYQQALERLALDAETQGDHTGAARWWLRLQTADPLSGRVTAALMAALTSAGDRAGALRHARAHDLLLREELGIGPDGAVTALADQLQSPRASAPTAHARDSASLTAPAVVRVSERRRRFVLAGVLGLGALVFGLVLVGQRLTGDAALDPNRLAVAVFENRTGDASRAALGYMVADWVTSGIARLPGLTVLDVGAIYTEASTPSGAPRDPQSLARRNDAGLVVTGNYYQHVDSLYFAAQIIDVRRGRVAIALAPIAASPDDPLKAIEELRQRITAALATISDQRVDYFTSDRNFPPRYEAYQDYVAAEQVYWRGQFPDALPLFRRALQRDSLFFGAAVRLAVAAVGTADCELADSIHQALEAHLPAVSEFDRTTIELNRARCDVNWEEALLVGRRRAELQPHSTFVQWTRAAAARRANRPAEALALLSSIDPAHDLGWLADPGKVFYWREYASAEHMLGDYSAELRTANRSARSNPQRLSTLYHRARSLAGAGRAAEAIRALDGIESLDPDAALVSGEIAGSSRPDRVATPGWVLYQLAAELLAHGDSASAAQLGERAVLWHEQRAGQSNSPELRIAHARALAFAGRYTDAQNLVSRLVAQDSSRIEYRGLLGVLAARLGDRSTAQQIDAWLAAQPAQRPPGTATLYRARIAAVLGAVPRALDLLESLPHRLHPTDFLFLHADPDLQAIRHERRFQDFIRARG